MQCYNREIEWNYAYFKKIRLCFYRKLKDVKFAFKDPAFPDKSKNKEDDDDMDYLLSNENPSVRRKISNICSSKYISRSNNKQM